MGNEIAQFWTDARILEASTPASIITNWLSSGGVWIGDIAAAQVKQFLQNDLQALLRNHHLQRVSRVAACTGMQEACARCLTQDLRQSAGLLQPVKMVKERVRGLADHDIRAVRWWWDQFHAETSRARKLPIEVLPVEFAIPNEQFTDLVRVSSELFELPNLEALRKRSTDDWIRALDTFQDRINQLATPSSWSILTTFAGFPSSQLLFPDILRERVRADWFDITRLALRELLKDDRYSEAKNAFEIDVLAKLSSSVGNFSFEQFESRLAERDARLDERWCSDRLLWEGIGDSVERLSGSVVEIQLQIHEGFDDIRREIRDVVQEVGRHSPNDAHSASVERGRAAADVCSAASFDGRNPYRFLDYYDITDEDELPGRAESVQVVIGEIRRRVATAGAEPLIFMVSGESGCGKTSFLRRGVLAAVNRLDPPERFPVIAIRPTDLHDESGAPDAHLIWRLLQIIARDIPELHLPPEALDRTRKSGARAAAIAAELLVAAIRTAGPLPARLFIGVDQFEEIVDDLAAMDRRVHAARWRPLVDFISAAVSSGVVGCVFTLESARRSRFDTLELPRVFREAFEMRLGGQDESFLEAVIVRPFERAGLLLHPKIVEELLVSYKRYGASTHGEASLLPLLALKLSNLFELVQGKRNTQEVARHRGQLQEHFAAGMTEISYAELRGELSFDSEIEDLANAAWGDRTDSEEEQLDDLNFLLQPLVAVSGDGLGTLTLQSIGESDFMLVHDLLAEFERARLVIREGGRRRLVHEAVVRRWSLASKWLARQREYLEDEAEFRLAAGKWARRGRQTDAVPSTEDAIDMAAAILRNYHSVWPFARLDDLTPSDRNLLGYAQAVFRHSRTPDRMVSRGFLKKLMHVHLAASYDMTDLVARLVEVDATCLHLRSEKGRTPLDYAAWTSAPTVKLLLEMGAQPDNVDVEGWPTITASIWTGRADIFRMLQPYCRTASSMACPSGTTLLHCAARRGRASMAATLLTTVTDVNVEQEDEWGRTALDYAAMFDQVETFALFAAHVDIAHRSSRNGFSVLHWAAMHGASKVLDIILEGAEYHPILDAESTAGETALMIAAAHRKEAVVARLVQVSDVNGVSEVGAGRSALHYAIAGNSLSGRETRTSRQQALRTVRALLAAPGIDPRLKDRHGKEPISLAIGLPQVRIELISHRGSDWSERLADGTTPLNLVIASKDRRAVERMVRDLALDVDLLSTNGDYSLNLLVVNDMADIALELLREGRTNPWNAKGAKAMGLEAAIAGGYPALARAIMATVPASLESHHLKLLSSAARVAIRARLAGEYLEELLACGTDPRLVSGDEQWSLLHVAALVGDATSFERLLRLDVSAHAPDAWGRYPIDLAPDRARAALEELLSRQRAELEPQASVGHSEVERDH